MKKWLLSLCMVLALVACKEEKKQEAAVESKPVIKIGVSLPLTGDIAYMGQALKGAVMVAEQQLNENNKLKNQIEGELQPQIEKLKQNKNKINLSPKEIQKMKDGSVNYEIILIMKQGLSVIDAGF